MEDRKTQIVELTINLIRQKGYVAISYDDLSRQLGVTKAGIHYFFKKKEDLGIAVTTQMIQILNDTKYYLSNSAISVDEKINYFICKQFEFLGDDQICPISSLLTDYESLPAPVKEKVYEASQLELDLLKNLLIEASNEGLIKSKSEEVEGLAIAVLSSIKGLLQYMRVLKYKDQVEQVVNQIKKLIKN